MQKDQVADCLFLAHNEVLDPPPDGWGPPPAGCRWAVRHDEIDARQDGLVWADASGEERFAAVSVLSGVGLSDREGDPTPPGCRVPAPWPCTVWPLGRSAEHLTAWLDYAAGFAAEDYRTEHLRRGRDDPAYGWLALADGTRLLARAEGVLPAARDADPLPDAKPAARAELRQLRTWLLADRPDRLATDFPKAGRDHRQVLRVLLRDGRLCEGDRLTAAKIVTAAFGPKAATRAYQPVIKALVGWKVVDSTGSAGGCKGGYWLSPLGADYARRLPEGQ